jgi:hypothetical protein
VSLHRGVIDSAEFVGPGTDIAPALCVLLLLPRLQQAGQHRRMHRVLKPERSPMSSRPLLRMPATEANCTLAEMERLNAQALALVNEHKGCGVPRDLIDAARKQANDVLGELAGRAITGKGMRLRGVPRAHGALVARVDRIRIARAGGIVRTATGFGAPESKFPIHPVIAGLDPAIHDDLQQQIAVGAMLASPHHGCAGQARA